MTKMEEIAVRLAAGLVAPEITIFTVESVEDFFRSSSLVGLPMAAREPEVTAA